MALVPLPPPRLPNAQDIDPANPEELRDFLMRLTAAVSRQLAARPSTTTAIDSRLFKSPDGTVYSLWIDDSGAVTATPFGSAQTKPVPP